MQDSSDLRLSLYKFGFSTLSVIFFRHFFQTNRLANNDPKDLRRDGGGGIVIAHRSIGLAESEQNILENFNLKRFLLCNA